MSSSSSSDEETPYTKQENKSPSKDQETQEEHYTVTKAEPNNEAQIDDVYRLSIEKMYNQYRKTFYFGMWLGIVLTPVFYTIKILVYAFVKSPKIYFFIFELSYAIMIFLYFLYGFLQRKSVTTSDLHSLTRSALILLFYGVLTVSLFCWAHNETLGIYITGLVINALWWIIWIVFFDQYKKFIILHRDIVLGAPPNL
jgi:hypothetical protein